MLSQGHTLFIFLASMIARSGVSHAENFSWLVDVLARVHIRYIIFYEISFDAGKDELRTKTGFNP